MTDYRADQALQDLTKATSLLAILEVADTDQATDSRGNILVDASVVHGVARMARQLVWKAHGRIQRSMPVKR